MVYQIQNHRIEVEDPYDGKFHDFCEEVLISKVITDLLSGRMEVEVTIYTASGGVTLLLPRGKINRHILPELINMGLTVIENKDQADFIMQVLLESEPAALCVYRHDRLGFCQIDGNDIFLAHGPIGLADPSKAASEYAFPKATQPKGTFESWKAVMESEVLGHPNLELALALGAVAPVAHLLMEASLLSLVPLFALIGRSSTGKTTTLRLIASIYGAPTEKGGMISDLNCTLNAFYAQLQQQKGVPALIDETTSAPEWDFGKVLYNLATGREKRRCQSDGQLKAAAEYSGAVIFTGERSLFDQTNGNDGLYARLVELTLPWTDDASHAARLEFGCRNNYGTAVVPLLNWLLQNQEELPLLFCELYNFFTGEVKTADGVEDRLLKTYSLVIVAAKVVTDALGLPLNIPGMQSLLLEHHKNCAYVEGSKDVLAEIYEHIKQQVLDHGSNFPTKETVRYTSKFWGMFDTLKGFPCVWIASQHFKEFLAEAKRRTQTGSESDKDVLRLLHQSGYIDRFYDDRYCKDKRLGSVDTKCYCLKLVGTTPLPPRKPKKKGTSQINLLLSESEDD